MIVRRVRVWSVARIAGILYATLGLIFGVLFALFSSVIGGIVALAAQQGGQAPPTWLGMFFGVGAIVILPIFYGVMGMIMASIMAGLYNLFAGLVGGIEIETQ